MYEENKTNRSEPFKANDWGGFNLALQRNDYFDTTNVRN